MMPLQMMRSAPPDFGDHGRTIGAMTRSGINDRPTERRVGQAGGLAADGESCFDGRRGRPHSLPYDGWIMYLYLYVCTAPCLLSNAQSMKK